MAAKAQLSDRILTADEFRELPEEGITDRFWEMAPDLAVEVVSPSNRASDMQRKALEYLDAGARLVWVVDPAERTVAVYRSRSDIRILSAGEVLTGEEVIPGLQIQVEGLFEKVHRS